MRHYFLSMSLLTGLLLLTACQKEPAMLQDDPEPITTEEENETVPSAADAARAQLAATLNVDAESITILESNATEWSDSCLGLGGPAESCLAAITPGYEVTLVYEETVYRYR